MRLGEPYPGLMMPAFTGTQTTADGNVTVVTVDIAVGFADTAATEQPSLARLFEPMPGSMLGAASGNVFRSSPVAGDAGQPRLGRKAWLIDHLMPNRTLRYRRLAEGNPPAPDTIRWLRRRLAVLYPARRAKWIDFRWYRNSYRIRHTTFELMNRVLIDSYHVDIAT